MKFSIRVFSSLVIIAGFAGFARADIVPGMGNWTTSLQARDLTGDGVADAFYDSSRNLTWLADAGASGSLVYASAVTWVNGLNVGGFDEWRLPSSLDTSGHWCYGYRCTDTEMGNLWLVQLGNLDESVFNGNSPIKNTGPFSALAGYYWTDLGDASAFWQDYFETSQGFSSYGQANFIELKVLPVHSGDIGAAIGQVPEPTTLALAIGALMGLGFACQRRAVGVRAV